MSVESERERSPGRRPSDNAPGAEHERRSWATLILVGLAQFMVTLDITVVNVALPSIDADLGFAAGDLQF